MSRALVAGLMALLPMVSAMPCLCATDKAPKKKSCCCGDNEQKPEQKSCCCSIKTKSALVTDTPSAEWIWISAAAPESESTPRIVECGQRIAILDTGPPIQSTLPLLL